MLYVDLFNILNNIEINRTFIEHIKFLSIKKLKKCTYINMDKSIKIDPFGFREYDARWLYEKNINLLESKIWKRVRNTNYKSHKKITQE